jgi:hypothetical protein
MLALFFLSAIIGLVVFGCTGIGFLSWLIGGAVFICGSPFTLILSFVHGEVSYAQDREDYRQMMAEIEAEELLTDHELAEDARTSRLLESSSGEPAVYNDNRQVHFHEK